MFSVPMFLLVAAFIGLRSDGDKSTIIAGAVLGFIIHLIIVCFSSFPLFLVVYVGAHTNPVGQALSWSGRLIAFAIEVLYGFFALVFCSILSGRKRPWPLRVPDL